MNPLKSQTRSDSKTHDLTSQVCQLVLHLLEDLAVHLKADAHGGSTRREIDRDIATITRESTNKGLCFFTKTLPSIGKALDASLAGDTVYIVPEGIRSQTYGGIAYPQLFGGLWKYVYTLSGAIKHTDLDGVDPRDPIWGSVEARNGSTLQIRTIRALRQICYLAYKMELPYEQDEVQVALDNFVERDEALVEPGNISSRTAAVLEEASVLLFRVLRDFDPLDIVPAHGPGAVATHEKPWEKYRFKRYYRHLDEIYSYADFFHFSYEHLVQRLHILQDLPESEPWASLVAVPKDSRGPRLISMEPLELQWIQQGVWRSLAPHIERCGITSGFVNFTDQKVNQDLATEASKTCCMFPKGSEPEAKSAYERDKDLVTLDLKDASDRVALWLVKRLFSRVNPKHGLLDALLACRSKGTELPDGRRIEFKKFAPMGSALCFPVEALVFWALCVASGLAADDLAPYTTANNVVPRNVWVYGDDLVVPRRYVETIREVFSEVGLVLNDGKCCVGKYFRESCGVDAFKGQNITPIRLRHADGDLKSPESHLGWVAALNALRSDLRGFDYTSHYMEDRLKRLRGEHVYLPVGEGFRYPLAIESDKCDTWMTACSLQNFKTRWNTSLQRLEVRLLTYQGLTLEGRRYRSWENVWVTLLRPQMPDPFGFVGLSERLSKHAVPHRIKLRWVWMNASDLFT